MTFLKNRNMVNIWSFSNLIIYYDNKVLYMNALEVTQCEIYIKLLKVEIWKGGGNYLNKKREHCDFFIS